MEGAEVGRIKGFLLRPLQSRKVRAAVATIVVAYLAEAGIDVSETMLMGILTVGVAYILGVAIEDAGAKSAAKAPVNGAETHTG